jgi:hypothetical protein
MEQQQFVGLGVSQAETAVCVVDEAGKVHWQGKCASTPEAIAATIRRRAPHAVRIAVETGPMSARHWRSLATAAVSVLVFPVPAPASTRTAPSRPAASR